MPAYAAGYEDAADPVSKFLWTFGEQANAPGTQHSPYNNTAGNNRSSLNTPLAGNDDSTGADKTPALCVPFVWLFRLCVVLVRFIIGVCFVPIGGACWIMTWVCLMFSLIYCISAPEESSAPPVDTLPPVIATATAVNEPAPVATSEVRVIYEDPVAIPVKGGNDKV
ncbi:hypothetical protein EON65_32000 [archaeon]|nr:MAG: hypothetical protein EON65_32000 [archaeon]